MNIELAEQTHDSLGVDAIFKRAINCHQSEHFAQAEELYLSALQIDSKHPDTNYNLGLMAMQLGKSEMGLPYLQTAWESDPTIGQYWLTLTECLLEMGHREEALMIIEDAILRGIDSPQSISLLMRVKSEHDKKAQVTVNNMGGGDGLNVVNLEGNFKIVGEPILLGHQQALSDLPLSSPNKDKTNHKNPKIKSAKSNHSLVKQNSNNTKKPSQKEINMLVSMFGRGVLDEAELLARRLVTSYPEHAFGWKSLGALLGHSGRSADGLASMQKAISLSPVDSEAHYDLGVIFRNLDRYDEAELSFRRAIELEPRQAKAHNNLGLVLNKKGRLREAEDSLRRAIQIQPNYADAHSNLATILRDLCQQDDAEWHFRRAIEIRPEAVDVHHGLLFFLSEKEGISAEKLFAEHCRFGSLFEGPLRRSWPKHENSRDPDKILKIGFVSGDFYRHAVSNFIEPVLINLAKYPQLSLYAYSDPEIEDETTNRLSGYFNHWYSMTGISDANLAEKIHTDGIDILIDLSGHTTRNRLLTFARKPAPVQVSWIGYPGTTGLQAMDYYLADHFFLPLGKFDDKFTEKIVHLPAMVAFSPYELAPPVNSLPALKNGYITFGSFNRLNKINPSVIALWSELLRALPNSKILLGGMPRNGENDRLIELFSLEGVVPERLILHPRDGMESYLALHHQVDFCLDTFPYAGGTTTLHALWMGVPTLTIAGDTAPGRGGACNLGHVGLSEFIADNKADFIRKGLLWADDLAVLSNLRADLRERFKSSAMGQPAIITAGLEHALRIMWRRCCADLPAESFEVRRQDVEGAVQEGEMRLAEPKQTLPIYVTQPLLPPLEDFIPYLQRIWNSKQLTNGGPYHQQLEQELCDYLGVKYISLFSNGTLALMTAMQALRITGEVITTPYSFVATSHSLLWNGIKPVFVDIDPVTLNLDPSKIEAAITPQTTAIMPVHCYGHPCDVKGIQKVADNYNLKVIYDAAHAFGVECSDGSILNHGDLSVLSFHATKVFNTFEGGAIVCHDAKTKTRIDQLKNFGFVDEVTVVATGINGKMSELNAAFGLLQLKNIDQALQNRKIIDARYRAALSGVKGIHYVIESGEKISNHAYFPILVTPDYLLSRDKLYQKLRDNGVYARRYFYPLVSDFPMYRGMPSAAHTNLPVAKKVAESVICLPIYPDLSNAQIDFIVGLISQEKVE